jgi:hypothetical protein
MSETNNTATASDNGKETRTIFNTLDEAKSAPSGNEREAVFEVLKDDAVIGYCWAPKQGGTAVATLAAARRDKYRARLAEPRQRGPITKEKVQAKLAELTDAELAEMGLTRKKGKK